jgi:hypothetical protein
MSFTATSYEFEGLHPRCRLATSSKHPQDRIEHSVQVLAYVLGKQAQHEVAVLLQQLVLPPVATIRDRVREVLSAIEFDRQTRVSAQQVDFECSEAVERNRQRHVDTEASIGLLQRVQSPIQNASVALLARATPSASSGMARAACTNRLASGVSTPSLMSLRTLPE